MTFLEFVDKRFDGLFLFSIICIVALTAVCLTSIIMGTGVDEVDDGE